MNPEEFRAFISNAAWRYAKSMPQTPHEYIVRPAVGSEDFTRAVRYIRQHGERRDFHGWSYIYLDLNGHSYWTMGHPAPVTIIINRRHHGE